MGILQARILEWVNMPSSRGSSQPRDQTQASCIAGRLFTIWATRKVQEYWSGLPCPPPGLLPNPGIKPRPPVLQADSLLSEPPGKPLMLLGISQRSWKLIFTQKTYTLMFIASLSIITKAWKQWRCPSVGEWVNKLVHPNNGLFSAKKKWAIKPWKDLKES